MDDQDSPISFSSSTINEGSEIESDIPGSDSDGGDGEESGMDLGDSAMDVLNDEIPAKRTPTEPVGNETDAVDILDKLFGEVLLPTRFVEERNEQWRRIIIEPEDPDLSGSSGRTILPVDLLPASHREQIQRCFGGSEGKRIESLNVIQTTVYERCLSTSSDEDISSAGRSPFVPQRILLSAPTGVGKTLVAVLMLLHEAEQYNRRCTVMKSLGVPKNELERFRVLYLTPMKALTREIVATLSKLDGYKVQEYTGDVSQRLSIVLEADILVATPEKAFQLLTSSLFSINFSLVIVDEIQLLASERGVILESLLILLNIHKHRWRKQLNTMLYGGDGENIMEEEMELRFLNNSYTSVLALSATVPNYEDVGAFLAEGVPCRVEDTKTTSRPSFPESMSALTSRSLVPVPPVIFHFPSAWRPVPLAREFLLLENEDRPLLDEALWSVVDPRLLLSDDLSEQTSILIFVHSRAETERVCRFLLNKIKGGLKIVKSPVDRIPLALVEGEPLSVENEALRDVLESCIRVGGPNDVLRLGFHSAALGKEDRKLVEHLFRHPEVSGLRVLVSTATLAWGVNLPAHTVVIRGTELGGDDLQTLPVSDIVQMMGRAGRPGLDTTGEAIVIGKSATLRLYLVALHLLDSDDGGQTEGNHKKGTYNSVCASLAEAKLEAQGKIDVVDDALRQFSRAGLLIESSLPARPEALVISGLVTQPGMTFNSIIELFKISFARLRAVRHPELYLSEKGLADVLGSQPQKKQMKLMKVLNKETEQMLRRVLDSLVSKGLIEHASGEEGGKPVLLYSATSVGTDGQRFGLLPSETSLLQTTIIGMLDGERGDQGTASETTLSVISAILSGMAGVNASARDGGGKARGIRGKLNNLLFLFASVPYPILDILPTATDGTWVDDNVLSSSVVLLFYALIQLAIGGLSHRLFSVPKGAQFGVLADVTMVVPAAVFTSEFATIRDSGPRVATAVRALMIGESTKRLRLRDRKPVKSRTILDVTTICREIEMERWDATAEGAGNVLYIQLMQSSVESVSTSLYNVSVDLEFSLNKKGDEINNEQSFELLLLLTDVRGIVVALECINISRLSSLYADKGSVEEEKMLVSLSFSCQAPNSLAFNVVCDCRTFPVLQIGSTTISTNIPVYDRDKTALLSVKPFKGGVEQSKGVIPDDGVGLGWKDIINAMLSCLGVNVDNSPENEEHILCLLKKLCCSIGEIEGEEPSYEEIKCSLFLLSQRDQGNDSCALFTPPNILPLALMLLFLCDVVDICVTQQNPDLPFLPPLVFVAVTKTSLGLIEVFVRDLVADVAFTELLQLLINMRQSTIGESETTLAPSVVVSTSIYPKHWGTGLTHHSSLSKILPVVVLSPCLFTKVTRTWRDALRLHGSSTGTLALEEETLYLHSISVLYVTGFHASGGIGHGGETIEKYFDISNDIEQPLTMCRHIWGVVEVKAIHTRNGFLPFAKKHRLRLFDMPTATWDSLGRQISGRALCVHFQPENNTAVGGVSFLPGHLSLHQTAHRLISQALTAERGVVCVMSDERRMMKLESYVRARILDTDLLMSLGSHNRRKEIKEGLNGFASGKSRILLCPMSLLEDSGFVSLFFTQIMKAHQVRYSFYLEYYHVVSQSVSLPSGVLGTQVVSFEPISYSLLNRCLFLASGSLSPSLRLFSSSWKASVGTAASRTGLLRFAFSSVPAEAPLFSSSTTASLFTSCVATGLVRSVEEFVDYLTWSFLFSRIPSNPTRYLQVLDREERNLLISGSPKIGDIVNVVVSQIAEEAQQEALRANMVERLENKTNIKQHNNADELGEEEEEEEEEEFVGLTELGKIFGVLPLASTTVEILTRGIEMLVDGNTVGVVNVLRLCFLTPEFDNFDITQRHSRQFTPKYHLRHQAYSKRRFTFGGIDEDSPNGRAFYMCDEALSAGLGVGQLEQRLKNILLCIMELASRMPQWNADDGRLVRANKDNQAKDHIPFRLFASAMCIFQCVQGGVWDDRTLLAVPGMNSRKKREALIASAQKLDDGVAIDDFASVGLLVDIFEASDRPISSIVQTLFDTESQSEGAAFSSFFGSVPLLSVACVVCDTSGTKETSNMADGEEGIPSLIVRRGSVVPFHFSITKKCLAGDVDEDVDCRCQTFRNLVADIVITDNNGIILARKTVALANSDSEGNEVDVFVPLPPYQIESLDGNILLHNFPCLDTAVQFTITEIN